MYNKQNCYAYMLKSSNKSQMTGLCPIIKQYLSMVNNSTDEFSDFMMSGIVNLAKISTCNDHVSRYSSEDKFPRLQKCFNEEMDNDLERMKLVHGFMKTLK